MKQIIYTNQAPEPIGPYSQAVLAGSTLYVSGQIPLDPSSGEMINSSIEDATRRVVDNIKAILQAAEMSFDNIIKSSIFLTDLGNFGAVNTVYGSYFSKDFPARETIQVSKLPKDATVEISVIAVK